MLLTRIGLACASLLLCASVLGQNQAENKPPAGGALSLQAAISATMAHNPELSGLKFRRQALEAERYSAGLKPEVRLSAEAENIAGSGDYTGGQSAETTLAISSIIELGGKRDARLSLAGERQAAGVFVERITELEVLAELTRRFIAVASAQEMLGLQQTSLQLAAQTTRALKTKVAAGNTPEAELARAQAQEAQAGIALHQAQLRFENAKTQLASQWAETNPTFSRVQADLFNLGPAVPLAELLAQLANNPDLHLLASQGRLKDAQLRLAESQRRADLQWSAGIRRLQASQDTAFTLGVSVPLGAAGRARGDIDLARAERALADTEQTSAQLRLRAQVTALYQEREGAVFAASSLRDQVIPHLTKAVRGAHMAFEKGRYSYLELASAQQELLAAQAALIDSAANAHLLRIEIERLTGNSTTAFSSVHTSQVAP